MGLGKVMCVDHPNSQVNILVYMRLGKITGIEIVSYMFHNENISENLKMDSHRWWKFPLTLAGGISSFRCMFLRASPDTKLLRLGSKIYCHNENKNIYVKIVWNLWTF